MRIVVALGVLSLAVSARADADRFRARPTFAIRGGIHRTRIWLDAIDGAAYGTGTPAGTAVAGEIEAGVRLHPAWSTTAFVDYAPFSASLSFEYPEPIEAHPYESRFRDLYVGARVRWYPIRRLSFAGAIARSDVWERNRPQDEGGTAFDSHVHGVVLQVAMGVELYRLDHVGVEVSMGVSGNPFHRDADHTQLYVPVFLGITWD